jgi:tetratricopeptide (TPR) repeat protein
LLEQALTDKPDHLFAKINLGRVLDATGEPAKARELWQSVIDAKGTVNPKSWPDAAADACFYIGRQYQLAQNPENAAKWYQASLGIVPTHVPAMTQLGTLLANSGRFAEGVTLIRQAAELSPGTPSVWTNLGNLYMAARQAADASDAYEHALRIKPDHIPARYGLATAQITLGQFAPAEKALRDLLQIRPDSPEILSALGGVLIRTNRLQEAQACLDRALQVRPGFPTALQQMQLLQQQLSQ